MEFPLKSLVTVLIPNGNIAPSMNVILLLKKQNALKLRIICSDSMNLAPGHYFADKSYFINFKNRKTYFDEIKKICLKEKVRIILPTRPFDNILFSSAKDEFAKFGILIPVATKDTVSLCSDKLNFYNFLHNKNIPYARVYTSVKYLGPRSEYILKPRVSSGSNDIKFILGSKVKSIPKTHILQDFIKGEEYTVDCLLSSVGTLLVFVIRRRIRVMQGMSIQSSTVKNNKITALVNKLFSKIKLQGLINIQLFVDDKNRLFVSEVNIAPAAGGLMLCEKAGVNFPLLLIKEALGIKFTKNETEYKENIYMTRYFQEIYYRKVNQRLQLLK